LSPFRDSGGKLIIWHGLADGGLSPRATRNYYDKVLAQDPNAHDYTRLYLIPGLGHGEGVGPGLSHEQWLDVIVDWVEHGKAPDTIIATKPAMANAPSISRPLSAYPKRSIYKGAGDPNSADSFESVAP
jgi:feruloyl esterase